METDKIYSARDASKMLQINYHLLLKRIISGHIKPSFMKKTGKRKDFYFTMEAIRNVKVSDIIHA